MKILGIDPGLRKTGWGILESKGEILRFIACGVIAPSDELPLANRLSELHSSLSAIIAAYTPGEAAIEETFVNRNALSSLKLGHARGALMLSISLAGITVTEYAATAVKKALVGVGRAEKEQVERMVRMLLPGSSPESADAADALAVAICHAHHRQSAIRMRQSVSVGT